MHMDKYIFTSCVVAIAACVDAVGGVLGLWSVTAGERAMILALEAVMLTGLLANSYALMRWVHTHSYADLWRESVAAQGWRAKVGVWVAPPGGWTDEPIAHFEPATFQRYTRQTPAAMRWYVALQYALLVPLVVHFLGIVKDIPTADALVYAGVIAFTAVALGALLEGLPWGRWLEMLRLLAVGAVFALLPDWFGFQAPVALRAAVLVFAVASVVWLLRRRTALGQVAA